MDPLKEAFSKVKEDISLLQREVQILRLEIDDLTNCLFDMRDILSQLNTRFPEKPEQIQSTTSLSFSSTDLPHVLDITTDNLTFKGLKEPNNTFSIGNRGVPADRQTDQQTDRQPFIEEKTFKTTRESSPPNAIEDAAKILDSLDVLKKEIRLKFRKLTEREFLLFSTIYQLDEEKGYTDYKELSSKLGITESSIRDYIGRLLLKGIPLEKIKVNNKTIHLKISSELKKIASLSTITQLINI